MPIYEYECEKCQCTFEALVSSSEAEAAPACPKCGGRQVKKLFSCFAKTGSGAKGGASVGCAPSPGKFS
ncbi:MAG: zinc ribbon domain-containing protein [Syntrophobacteraceae bacterium]